MGNQTSQLFALYYLDPVDRLVKERLRVKHYTRYMDDMVLLHPDKEYLQECLRRMRALMESELCIAFNEKTHIFPLKNGVDYLGWHFYLTDTGKVVKRLILEAVLSQREYKPSLIDLGDVGGLKPYVRRRIGVSGRCGEDCPCYEGCRYLRHMKRAQSGEYDFQVCNHNYYLADTLHRAKGQRPLIPHYQAVIIDEAHKFLSAARQMYGVELPDPARPDAGAHASPFGLAVVARGAEGKVTRCSRYDQLGAGFCQGATGVGLKSVFSPLLTSPPNKLFDRAKKSLFQKKF